MSPLRLSGVADRLGGLTPERASDATPIAEFVSRLRELSLSGLAKMYDASTGTFVFRVKDTSSGARAEGHSLRYTAITLIGLAAGPREDAARVTGPHTPADVYGNLQDQIRNSQNLGDVALTLFAGGLMGRDDVGVIADRLVELAPADRAHPVVELAWALSALSLTPESDVAQLRDRIAERLMSTFNAQSALFPHLTDSRGARSHVCCFADLIYPIQALSMYAMASRNRRALDIASRSAAHLCRTQGAEGQWWWHYDYRTGKVLEKYPVYAIHQDAMGPMGLFALRDAGGPDFSSAIVRGLTWLESAPELSGGSLIDPSQGLIWRKVARREPRKAVRYFQASAARLHPSLRMPAVDRLFPAVAIDYEDRPYHLGWLLHAWRGTRESSLHQWLRRA